MSNNYKNNQSIRFDKLEKIQDLRTQEEIALKDDRTWARKIPPRPVLPPYGTLVKIEGSLERFSSESYREYFGVKAYRTNNLPGVSDIQRGAGAAVAIAAGSPAVGALLMTDDDSLLSDAEYVQGSIDGEPFRGWVGMTRLKAGDRVEVVADWQEDHYEVYAITLPEEHIISVCPRCDMGHIAHIWLRIKYMYILTGVLLGAFATCSMIDADGSFSERLEYNFFSHTYDGLWLMIVIMSFLITGVMAYFVHKAYAPTTCKLAEEIFQVLGMQDVAKINLNKKTKKHEMKLKKEGRWHSPAQTDKQPCPSQTLGYSGESWHYY